ncbi:hypothetical protein AMR72_15060 [Flavobacterium psychrophilum]|nr:hypothetical protein AMR72_15060 [Flavobacterium psychrophilum]AOE53718.1 hypothetical protein ALW18_15050 [Flavobacterium psychrophilum]
MFSSYIIIFIFLAVFSLTIVSVYAVMLFNKNKTAIGTDGFSSKVQNIQISPIRPTLVGIAFMFIGLMFCYLLFSGFQIPPDFSESYTYISIIFGLIGIGMAIFGLYVFLRRNTIVQLKMDAQGLYYVDVDWTPSKSRNVFGLFFKKPVKYLPFTNITDIVVIPNAMYGDSIYIYTNTGGFYLPYLGDNKHHTEEVLQLIRRRIAT